MEFVLSLAIGVMAGAGVWLLLRPRTFQVLIGLSLLSYAVNLFIFSVGSLAIDKEPILLGRMSTRVVERPTADAPIIVVCRRPGF